MRRLTTLLLTAALAAGLASARPAVAHAGGGDNAAIAVNTKDGSSLFRFAFAIRRVAGDVVDQTNAAVSYASCNSCQTVAIAIEVVLVTGDPSVVTPTNVALAINDQCTDCATLASAYQFVFGTGGEVHFSAEGNKAISEIKKDIRDLGKQDLSIAEIQARLTEIVGRLRQVLATELVPAGKSGGDHGGNSDQAQGSGTGPPGGDGSSPAGGSTEPTTTTEPTATGPPPTDTTSTPTEPTTTSTQPAATTPVETTTAPTTTGTTTTGP